MTDDIIRMAREAGLRSAVLLHMYGKEEALCDSEIDELRQLERFAALVVKPWADQLEVERKRFQELNDVAALGMQHARAAEREAIAKMVEGLFDDPNDAVLEFIVDAIRARGNT